MGREDKGGCTAKLKTTHGQLDWDYVQNTSGSGASPRLKPRAPYHVTAIESSRILGTNLVVFLSRVGLECERRDFGCERRSCV